MAVRNYRYFFAFVGATVVLIFYMMAAMLARVVLRLAVEGDGSVERGLEVVASGAMRKTSGLHSSREPVLARDVVRGRHRSSSAKMCVLSARSKVACRWR